MVDDKTETRVLQGWWNRSSSALGCRRCFVDSARFRLSNISQTGHRRTARSSGNCQHTVSGKIQQIYSTTGNSNPMNLTNYLLMFAHSKYYPANINIKVKLWSSQFVNVFSIQLSHCKCAHCSIILSQNIFSVCLHQVWPIHNPK